MDVELGEGCGPSEGGFWGGAAGRGCQVAGGSPDPQEERVLIWHWSCGGDVEGSGSDFKYLDHSLHHLP